MKLVPLSYLMIMVGLLNVSCAEHLKRSGQNPKSVGSESSNANNKANKGAKMSVSEENREELKKTLSPLQYAITQECGTEPAFQNAYWDNKKEGLYVDIVSGQALFLSKDKFDSGSGWPSFTKPIDSGAVEEKSDTSLSRERTEVVSSGAKSHLGHVFDDGPKDKGGLRYCINSAALRFIPVTDLEKEGYGRFVALVDPKKQVQNVEYATFAGGCFWGMEDLIRKEPGVLDTEVGYTGGITPYATYQNHQGHAEAVQIRFDPTKTSYENLVRLFFRIHDPTTLNRQGNDVGTSYRSAIFYHGETQRASAQKILEKASIAWGSPVATEIEPAAAWWKAEDNHQDYLIKNPNGYTCHFIRNDIKL